MKWTWSWSSSATVTPYEIKTSIAINSHKLPEAYQWLKRTRICLIGAKVVGLYLKSSIASIQVCFCVAGVEEGCTIAEVPWDLLLLLFFSVKDRCCTGKKYCIRNYVFFRPSSATQEIQETRNWNSTIFYNPPLDKNWWFTWKGPPGGMVVTKQPIKQAKWWVLQHWPVLTTRDAWVPWPVGVFFGRKKKEFWVGRNLRF